VEIVNGKKIAEEIHKENKSKLNKLITKYKIYPTITTIKIGDDLTSNLYLKLRDNACKKTGIISKHVEFSENVSELEILRTIKNLNNDKKNHGILIQFPIPKQISSYKLINSIDPNKDVEGFNPHNIGNLLNGNEYLVPCTPLSVLKILEYTNTIIEGKNIVIVNHSNIVGKPLSILLLNRNATVSVCHVFTDNTKRYTKKADILISATGIPKLITLDHVKKNSFVIDVGIVKTKDGICGDVDFDNVKIIVDKITPVPGGVGPVTVACSIINMIKTYKNCIGDKTNE
jgi:methylenetetrahydrofolate dehydrogenase (NADP+)/methenyltetrahydrofolate cyclohydrolase